MNYKDRKKVAAQLRLIYKAPTEQAARDALDAWCDSEIGRQYPAIRRQWEAAWEQVIPFFAFPPEVRRIIYSTDEIVKATPPRRLVLRHSFGPLLLPETQRPQPRSRWSARLDERP